MTSDARLGKSVATLSQKRKHDVLRAEKGAATASRAISTKAMEYLLGFGNVYVALLLHWLCAGAKVQRPMTFFIDRPRRRSLMLRFEAVFKTEVHFNVTFRSRLQDQSTLLARGASNMTVGRTLACRRSSPVSSQTREGKVDRRAG